MKVIITESQLNTLILQESKWWDTAKEIGTKLFNKISNYFNDIEVGVILSHKPNFITMAGATEYKRLFKALGNKEISKREFMDRIKKSQEVLQISNETSRRDYFYTNR